MNARLVHKIDASWSYVREEIATLHANKRFAREDTVLPFARLFFMHNTKRFKVATTVGGAELRRLGWWRTKACKWSDKSVELRISCWYAKMHELSNFERCALQARYAGMDGQLGPCVRVCGCWAVSQCRWGLPIWQQHTVDSSIFIKCCVCCCSALLRYILHIYLTFFGSQLPSEIYRSAISEPFIGHRMNLAGDAVCAVSLCVFVSVFISLPFCRLCMRILIFLT